MAASCVSSPFSRPTSSTITICNAISATTIMSIFQIDSITRVTGHKPSNEEFGLERIEILNNNISIVVFNSMSAFPVDFFALQTAKIY